MSGIKVERHKVLVYAIAGVLASVAAHRALARKNLTAQAGMGVMYELDAIAMAVIGGVVALRRARLDRRHRARRADLRRDHLRLHLPEARRLLPGDGQGRDHRRRRGARLNGGRRAAAAAGHERHQTIRAGRAASSDARQVILKTEGLTKHYGGVHALEDCQLRAPQGRARRHHGRQRRRQVDLRAPDHRRSSSATAGKIWFDGQEVEFKGPLEAREAGIETVFQNLALADDLDVPSNLFLGREKILLQPRAVLDPRLQGRCARRRSRGAEEDRR